MKNTSTLEKITKSARSEFGMYGFDGARVDRIAKRARVNKAMIYYHFKSKESLYESILSELYTLVFERITSEIPKNKDPEEQLDYIISQFIEIIKNLDRNFIRIMLRELSTGGKYFKKLVLPRLIIPMVSLLQDLFIQGIEQGLFREVHPQFTFIQTVGSIVFFNLIRITLEDTELGKTLFTGDFFEQYKRNLLLVMKNGIIKKRR